MSKETPSKYHFYATARDDRRSNEWLITVAGPKRADVFVAPSSMFGQVKVSLHESGYCQVGLTRRLRDRVSWRFRGAQERWQYDRHQVTTSPAFAVLFREDQLVALQKALHPDSISLRIDPGRELWVLFMIQPKDSDVGDSFAPLQQILQVELGDGTTLEVLTFQQPANPDWLSDIASFDPVVAIDFPQSLADEVYGYAIASMEGIDCFILETSGATVREQGWSQQRGERADRKTTEEYVMERLEQARNNLDQAMGKLQELGPVWDGHQLGDVAATVADALTAGLEALSNLAHIAQVDRADLLYGLREQSELAAWLKFAGQLGSVCDDPNCPDHRVE